MPEITRQMLLDYIHDALPDTEMAAVERALRGSPELRSMLNEVREDEDQGQHTVGAIWRRERVSCPSRDQLGGYLLGAGDPDLLNYVEFHLTAIGCPYCQANLDDLRRLQGGEPSGR